MLANAKAEALADARAGQRLERVVDRQPVDVKPRRRSADPRRARAAGRRRAGSRCSRRASCSPSRRRRPGRRIRRVTRNGRGCGEVERARFQPRPAPNVIRSGIRVCMAVPSRWPVGSTVLSDVLHREPKRVAEEIAAEPRSNTAGRLRVGPTRSSTYLAEPDPRGLERPARHPKRRFAAGADHWTAGEQVLASNRTAARTACRIQRSSRRSRCRRLLNRITDENAPLRASTRTARRIRSFPARRPAAPDCRTTRRRRGPRSPRCPSRARACWTAGGNQRR